MSKERHWTLKNLGQQFLNELNAISETEKETREIVEKDFPDRKFPLGQGEEIIRKFYEDESNISRTIFCPEINVDEIDDWGMFGYTPGFIYIESKRYEGSRTLADEASLLGLSTATSPSGISLISHFDYFPKYEFNYQLIRKSHYPADFEILLKMFGVKRLEGGEGE